MELRQQGQAIDLAALRASGQATGKVLLLVHGLCMNDLQWLRAGHDHGAHLAQALDCTPVYVRYNTGLHTSINGGELAGRVEALLADWPVPVQELNVLVHSMGGLVVRSAVQQAVQGGLQWPGRLRKLVFLGTPHHGAPLERAGNWVDVILGSTPGVNGLCPAGAFAQRGHHRFALRLRAGGRLAGHDRFRERPDARHHLPCRLAWTAIPSPPRWPASAARWPSGWWVMAWCRCAVRWASTSRRSARWSFPKATNTWRMAWVHMALLEDAQVAQQLVRWFG